MARFNRFARGKRPNRTPRSGMNGLEAKWAEQLEYRKRAGEILHYQYEGIKLRLADNTFYTPDFYVQLASGEIEMHEVKGFWEDAGRIKIKVAAALHPFRFLAIQFLPKKKGGGAQIETFGEVDEEPEEQNAPLLIR